MFFLAETAKVLQETLPVWLVIVSWNEKISRNKWNVWIFPIIRKRPMMSCWGFYVNFNFSPTNEVNEVNEGTLLLSKGWLMASYDLPPPPSSPRLPTIIAQCFITLWKYYSHSKLSSLRHFIRMSIFAVTTKDSAADKRRKKPSILFLRLKRRRRFCLIVCVANKLRLGSFLWRHRQCVLTSSQPRQRIIHTCGHHREVFFFCCFNFRC